MASRREEVLLSGDFTLLSKKRTVNKVTLTRLGLFYGLNSSSGTSYEEKCVQISDVIGCHSLDSTIDQTPTTTITNNLNEGEDSKELNGEVDITKPTTPTYAGIPKISDPSILGFVIFAYPFKKKVFSSKKVRCRVVLGFSLPQQSNEVYEERKKKVELWKNVINCLCRDIPVNFSDLPNTIPPPQGKLLVLINPRSGPGKAHTIFKTSVLPMLQEASIPFKAVVTEYSGHATDILKDLNLSEWYAIVIVSGDGLIFEAINGLMSRGDWLSSIQTPIGCLPGGSGNALCCSINYAAGEPISPNAALHSTFILIKHRVVPMDLVLIHVPNRTMYSFLSITWGIMADIDYESEKFRNLGETRFTVGALRRIINLRTYKGRLSFLPVAEYHPKEDESFNSSGKKILSKIRSFSLRSRSSSKSTLNSLEETGSPQLLKHRSLSMDQSGYSEAQVVRSNVDYSKEIDRLTGGGDGGMTLSASCQSDSLVGNGFGHNLPLQTFSEDGEEDESGTSLSDPVAEDLAGLSEKTSSSITADNSSRSEHVEGTEPNGDVNNFHSMVLSSAVVAATTDGCGDRVCDKTNPMLVSDSGVDDSVFTECNGDLSNKCSASSLSSSSLKDDNSNSNSIVSAATTTTTTAANKNNDNVRHGHQKSKSDVSFTVMAEAEEIKVEKETYTGNKADFAPVPSPLLPPLDQPVPDNWVTLEDDYVLVSAVYQTHLGSDMLAAPDAHLNDGFIHLIIVKGGISRNALLNLFLTFGEGSHVHSPYVDSVKVLAFRLEPLTTAGNLAIDGERFEPSALQAQVLPGLAKVMAIQ